MRQYPSAGFLLLMASHLLLVSVLAWGYSQPELDRAWQILQDAHREGFTELKGKDIQLLQRQLKTHPELGSAIVGRDSIGFIEPTNDGWASRPSSNVIIRPVQGTRSMLLIECRASSVAFPVTVTFESESLHQSLRFSENGRQTIGLPAQSTSFPFWAKMRIQSRSQAGYTAQLPEVRVAISATLEPKASP